MKNRHHKFLIWILVLALIVVAYLYFSKSMKSEASEDSSLNSSLGDISSEDSQIAQDTAFLSTLSSLMSIKIDTSIFKNKSFLSLKDNSVKLDTPVAGRTNPFAPLISTDNPVSNVGSNLLPITNQTLQTTLSTNN